MRLELCNLKEFRSKDTRSPVFIAQVLCINLGQTAIIDSFVDKDTYDKLYEIFNDNLVHDKVTLIDEMFIEHRISYGKLVCSIDFKSFIDM